MAIWNYCSTTGFRFDAEVLAACNDAQLMRKKDYRTAREEYDTTRSRRISLAAIGRVGALRRVNMAIRPPGFTKAANYLACPDATEPGTRGIRRKQEFVTDV